MKKKYIRFFISSTFDDMKKERNLLQEVLSELANDYSQQGWQIESIDLRWGISEEAGLDNKTMRICKEELRRCQELSPKPNFVLLLGNRYGWIPLPEIINYKEGSSLLSQMNNSERKLFYDWYKLDENALPEGEYVLQRRGGKYVNQEVWETDVETPLLKIFAKHSSHSSSLFGLSATEQEIQMGALSVENAQEHVLGYFRNISDISELPNDIQKKYNETGADASSKTEKLENLKRSLNKTIGTNNRIDLQLTYAQYQTQQFNDEFKKIIERKLRDIIQNTIESFKDNIWENNLHMAMAAEEAKSFVGREKDLNYIDNYIKNKYIHKTLWIKGESGAGKTALLAKIATNYSKSHDVICRFCGRTQMSINNEDLLTTLWLDINNLDIATRDKCPNGFYPIWKQFQERLEGNINKLKGRALYKRPILIVIDAIDQVNKNESDDCNSFFSKMLWLDCELAENVKVIISSTDELKFKIENPHFEYYDLKNMGGNSIRMVDNILHNKNRTLTAKQHQDIEGIVSSSDKSAIYLQVLGSYLCGITSNEDISNTPNELSNLIILILDSLSRPERHGKIIVSKVLSWLAFENIGFTQDEVIDLLSSDKDFCVFFKANSKHDLSLKKGEKIPIIFWSRLLHDILPFLRIAETTIGITVSIFHNKLKQIVWNHYAKSIQEKAIIALTLYNFYKKHAKFGNMHALLELIKCGHSAAAYFSHFDNSQFNEIRKELFVLLSQDLDFLASQIIKNKKQLDVDFKYVSDLYNAEDNNKLREVKNELYRAERLTNEKEQLLSYLKNTTHNLILQKALSFQFNHSEVMDNTLSSYYKDCDIHHINKLGKSPCMSEDGNIVASLFQNRHLLIVENLFDPKSSKSYSFKESIIQMDFNDKMSLVALRLANYCSLFNITEGRTIYTKKMSSSGWMSLSQDGKVLAYGDDNRTSTYNIGTQEETIYDVTIKSGRLDPSGTFLWSITNENLLVCYNILEDLSCEIPITKKDEVGIINPLEKENYIITDCTNCRCLINNGKGCSYLIGYNEIENKLNTFFYNISEAIKLNYNNQQVFVVHRGNYQIVQYNSDNCTMVSSTPMSSFICVNHNFTRVLTTYSILDLESQIKKYTPNQGGLNSGLNGMSNNNEGDEISISSGINENCDLQKEILRISGEYFYKWKPPFTFDNYLYVSCTAISPNGQYIAAASCGGKKSQIVLSTINGQRIASYDTKESCISILFSNDSRYLIGITGHRLYSPPLWMYIIDQHGYLIFSEKIADDCVWPQIKLSDNNRIAFIDNMSFDLVTCKYTKANTYSEFPTFDNKYKWIIEEACLYLIHEVNKKELLMKDVRYSFAALDSNHIYIVQNNGTILLYNIDSRVIEQRAFWGKEIISMGTIRHSRSSILFKTCAKGLIAVNYECEVALFKPLDSLNVNKPAVTKFVRRWNLKDKVLEDPTAICPMCGCVIDIDPETYKILKDNPIEVKSEDWDNPKLFGHYCPHCNAELRYNPYIA